MSQALAFWLSSLKGLVSKYVQGGLTDLWLDDPYVVAASKLIKMAEAENAAGNVFPVCLAYFLLYRNLAPLNAPL